MLAFFPLLYYHAACRVLTPIITQQVKENNMNLKNKQEIIKEYGKNEKRYRLYSSSSCYDE